MPDRMSDFMPDRMLMSEHIPGLKLVHLSQHMSDSINVRTHAKKDVRTQSRTLPSLCDR